ncbi:hypothetical protein M409DRAFT_24284 [Zasmidium cellare ATCC 36951]|uniref:MYND-type domain-containing protein n=1 Tax=Zasmidium cellare ATCC 36951 TaxID=1080233 RepID=A0A6A6CDZ9_ZASCE|nr:uncharacterized protein M409DRAFT_24284 [Zasmidium cellare ATCC 36951]KAF2165434.1 hypothetical protein M409DRAFT_24284 [Zasmidium cellare ATCC 36951]
MGAWGLGLFESDHDYDIISDLDAEAGLHKLAEDAQAKLKAEEEAKGIKHGEDDDENSVEARISYSIYADHCSDFDLVRTYLQSSGELEKMIEKWTAKAQGWRNPLEWHNPGYKLVLIGACAMMYGCTLKDEFIQYLRDTFTEVGLMRDALKQVDTTLNGPHGFKNGVPYKWGSFGVHEKAKNPDDDLLYPPRPGTAFTLINVPSPGPSLFRAPDNSAFIKKIKARMELIKQEKSNNVCGGCGAADGKDGKALLSCAKCKVRQYCSRECQKDHWETHKQLCAKPPGDPSNNERVKSVTMSANSLSP